MLFKGALYYGAFISHYFSMHFQFCALNMARKEYKYYLIIFSILVRFLRVGIEHLNYCLVPNNMELGWMFGLQVVYLLNFFLDDPFCRSANALLYVFIELVAYILFIYPSTAEKFVV